MKWTNWIIAARPKTLFASLSPVILGASLAFYDGVFAFVPVLLCALVALCAQIASNFANDYFDFKKGADGSGRLGPERAVASGWITPRAMLQAACVMLGLCTLFGSLLLFYGGWIVLLVGVCIIVFALAYTGGPFPLAYHGLGDICVLVFFGIVPVCFTYYVQALAFTPLVFSLSLSLGFLSMNILVVNNYRDYAQDKNSKKKTTIVYFGKKFGLLFYLINLILASLFSFPLMYLKPFYAWLPLVACCYFITTWIELKKNEGHALNITLAHTARNVLLYALLLSFMLCI